MNSFGKNEPDAVRGESRRTIRRLGMIAALLVVIALLVAACGATAEPAAPPEVEPTPEAAPTDAPAAEEPAAPGAIVPSVTVADQRIVDGAVTIDEVVSDGPGWLVVHAQADGSPGPILGYGAVASGSNNDLTVAIDAANATETLYAMLHIDAGEEGTFEFPNGPDTPAMAGDRVVTPAFIVRIQAAGPSAQDNSSIEIPAGAVVVNGDEAEVEIEDFLFQPKVLVIEPGTTVKFANKDRVPHTATSDTGIFDSGYLSKGQEYYYTFTEPGVYPYYCIPHGGPGGVGMAATIIVQP